MGEIVDMMFDRTLYKEYKNTSTKTMDILNIVRPVVPAIAGLINRR